MLTKVLSVLSVLKVCTGENLFASQSYQQPQYAISSQSYVRHDVPLSYQYSSVHLYSTMKPQPMNPLLQYPNYQPVTPSYYADRTSFQQKEMQYAPIFRNKDLQHTFSIASDLVASLSIQNDTGVNKKNLEPKINNQEQLTFVPDYNAEMLQAVNRFPGHNAIYRSHPKIPASDKMPKMNYLNQFVFYQKPQKNEYYLGTTPPTQISTIGVNDFVPKQYIQAQSSNTYKLGQDITTMATPQLFVPISKSNLQSQIVHPQHPKTHLKLLNVARAYNIAKHHRKAQKETNKPRMNLLSLPTLQLPKQQLLPEMNTLLNPVEKKNFPGVLKFT